MKKIFSFAFLLFVSALSAQTSKPNIIYIYADDLGYGELGSYGQTRPPTSIAWQKRECGSHSITAVRLFARHHAAC